MTAPETVSDQLPARPAPASSPIADGRTPIRVKGKLVSRPAVLIDDRLIVAHGRWLRTATIHDEFWLDGPSVREPERVLATLREQRFPADLLTFAQRLPDIEPKFPYHFAWDNLAVIDLTSYTDWWENLLPQETRKHVRKAAKRGLVTRTSPLDDAFVEGIVAIYNEVPIRQGKPFPKYGQNFATVKEDMNKLAERSEFIGAYLGAELVGFIKLVHMGPVTGILSINSKSAHFDLKPTNALMAKAVEVACARHATHLTYGRYTYGNKPGSSLTEFKKRNGFHQVMIPRYYVPLNVRGRIAVRLRLYRRLIDIIPPGPLAFLDRFRSAVFNRVYALKHPSSGRAETSRGAGS
jgi:hypothetical protein